MTMPEGRRRIFNKKATGGFSWQASGNQKVARNSYGGTNTHLHADPGRSVSGGGGDVHMGGD